ncbi:hypothetical protein C0J52_17059 [Blattella germanica]|nr:hypothetical protein C0J52_17059 [Blattella germanica]
MQHIFLGSTWALKLLDSSAKFPSSILMGNLLNFGNYDECLSVTVHEEWGAFVGQHCVVSIPNIIDVKTKNISSFYVPISGIPTGWSVCLPSSCSAQDLENMLRAVTPLNITVSPFLCHNRKQQSSFNVLDWTAIVILAILAITCIIGTIYTLFVENPGTGKKQCWLTMFSWYKNGSNLLTTKSNPDSISVLHGVRVFSIIWVVMGHSYEFHSYLPQINYLYGLETIRKWRLLYITNAVLAVDTCFVLSGLLLSYIFMKTMDNGHQFNLPMFYIHRFIRIMPVLVMIVLLEASLMSKIGSGPLWELGVVNTLQKNCKKYWWSTLLFVQNYVNVENMCIPASWYLAVDMQMYWISPIFLLALHKKPKFGISLLTAAVFMGVAVAFQQAYFFEDLASGVPTNGKINDRYYQTHSRFVPWVIGLTCGYLLYRTTEWRKKVALHKAKLSKYILLSGWASSIIIFIGVIHWVYHFEQINYVYNAIDSSLYIALARPLWASAVSWVIFACSSGYGDTLISWLHGSDSTGVNCYDINSRSSYSWTGEDSLQESPEFF